MKKILCMAICLVMLCTNVFAADGVTVYINGQELASDVSPFIEDGRTLVPLRAFFEALDVSVAWDAETKTVAAANGDINVILQIDSELAFVNGQPVVMDVAAVIVENRTFVPVRFVAESLSAQVEWNPEALSVNITK